LLLVRAASWLAPSAEREEWRREWESEIRNAARVLGCRGCSAWMIESKLWQFARGSAADALWHRTRQIADRRPRIRAELRERAGSPSFCLITLGMLITVIALASGGLSATRDVVFPLPYEDPERVATVSHGGMLVATRAAVRVRWTGWWRAQSRLLEGAASYVWKPGPIVDGSGVSADGLSSYVDESFFALLGARTISGHRITRADFESCDDCAAVTYDFWQRHGGSSVRVNGRQWRIAAVLEPRFWFLNRDIDVWPIVPGAAWRSDARTGVVVRLRRNAALGAAVSELGYIVEQSGVAPFESLIEISPLGSRARSVFGSFALALGLALVIIAAGLNLRLVKPTPQAVLFFTAKTAAALAAVLLAGLEFTSAASITMIGGTDLATEPLSTWLFLMASAAVLSWSIADQRRRCRTCLRRLGMATHVGCSGSLLLNWAGTELVCIEGHGMLHVPEMESSWNEPERWTVLDDSWRGLFVRQPG
jgi:hypothetical protein